MRSIPWSVHGVTALCGSSPFGWTHDQAFIEQAEVIEKILTHLDP